MVQRPKNYTKEQFKSRIADKLYQRKTPSEKLELLSIYMIERMSKWPNKIVSFEVWVVSYLLDQFWKQHCARRVEFHRICSYCGCKFQRKKYKKTKDHVIPLSKGGPDTTSNKLPCCEPCNHWKNDMTPEQWLQDLRRTIGKRKANGSTVRVYTREEINIMISNLTTIINTNKDYITRYSSNIKT